ncbi:MAG: hypothetical protein Q7W16_08515 [Coriobacteriia bacterium]|nr:hypothetical protein [Coriobacteriia bacterium]
MRGFARSLKQGAIAGVVIGVVAALALGAYLMVAGAATVSDPTKIVVVFAMAREDGAPVAHTIAVVRPGAAGGGREYYMADASATVSVPGVSDSQLAEAYAYGGAEGVAAAHDGGSLRRGTAWIDVPPAVWERLVRAGVDVTLTEGFDVYDGERFMEFPPGAQRVPAGNLRGLANGLAYLPFEERRTVREALADASMAALTTGAKVPAGVATNLSPTAWQAFVSGWKNHPKE